MPDNSMGEGPLAIENCMTPRQWAWSRAGAGYGNIPDEHNIFLHPDFRGTVPDNYKDKRESRLRPDAQIETNDLELGC